MEAQAKPELLEEIDADERAFLESIEADMPEGEELSAIDARLDYLLERVAEREAQIDHVSEVAEKRMDMIRTWRDEEVAKVERELDWLEEQIRKQSPRDVEHCQEIYGKKSVRLPHGKVGFRKSRDSVEIEESDAALEWARDFVPEAVKVRESVLKTPLIEHAQNTGEMEGPGWRFVPAENRFYIKAGG